MTKRRPKGEGSVYRRKDGRVVGEYVDAHGRTRYMTSTTMTKAEMKTALRKKLEQRDQGIAYDHENLTVGEYLDRWLDSIRGTVRERSWIRYEQMSRLHLKPSVGNVKLHKLTALHLQQLYGEKLRTGLSARTVQYIHTTAHTSLKRGVSWNLIPRNVADAATPPKGVKREMKVLSTDQMRTLLDAAKGDKLEALYVLACTTAMRQGELLGLMWRDVNLDAGTLTVNRTVYDGAITPPKTAAGNRTIKLSRLAIAALRQHRVESAKRRISEWVFPSDNGTTIGHQNLHNRSWKPLLRRAGLPNSTRFHDLRHSAITLLLSEGYPVKVVSEMAGHADPGVTMKVYQSVLPHMQDEVAAHMDTALGEGL